MNQMTLRKIPEELERQLRRVAKERGQSLNKTAIELMMEALGLKKEPERKRDLSQLAGSWSQEEADAFDRNVQIFEQVDEEMWR